MKEYKDFTPYISCLVEPFQVKQRIFIYHGIDKVEEQQTNFTDLPNVLSTIASLCNIHTLYLSGPYEFATKTKENILKYEADFFNTTGVLNIELVVRPGYYKEYEKAKENK